MVLISGSGDHTEAVTSVADMGTITITGCTTSTGTVLVCTILLEALMLFTEVVSMVVVMAAGGIAEGVERLSLRIGSWIDSRLFKISITL